MANIQASIDKLFRAFHPQYMAFWSSTPLPQCRIEAQYVVAQADAMMVQPEWPEETDIHLSTVANNDYYAWYQAIYDQFHHEQPTLQDRVPSNTFEELEASRQQGLLFFIEYQQQTVGLISAENNELLGHSGLYFNEIMLDKPWRGKGLAKAAQRQFIAQTASDTDLIWGTINANNIASLKTAYANQRRGIRYECFYPLNALGAKA